MSFNDEQIKFFNNFLVKIYKKDMNEKIIDGRLLSFEEVMEELYNNNMKTYFQQEYIENPIRISFDLYIEICHVNEETKNEYKRLFGESDFKNWFGTGEPNIVVYCQSLTLEDLFVILQEEMGQELNEIYEMYGLDFVMPK